jgi:hypothetical protein
MVWGACFDLRLRDHGDSAALEKMTGISRIYKLSYGETCVGQDGRFQMGRKDGLMRTFFILLVALVVLVGASYADGVTRLGVSVKVPWTFSVQLTLPVGFAVEAGLSQFGPAVFAAKLYMSAFDLAGFLIVPVAGLGGAIAFLPGDLVAMGFYALGGLEVPIPETSLSPFANLVVVLPWWPEGQPLNFGTEVGLRLDFLGV